MDRGARPRDISLMDRTAPHNAIHTDIAIVGGGLSGLAGALAFARGGMSVAVIDAVAPEKFLGAAFDGRVTAIAYAAARMLDRLGLKETLLEHGQPINDILVTDGRPADRFRKGGPSRSVLHFDSRDIAEAADAPLGVIIENRHLRAALYEACAATDGIDIIAPARVAAVDFAADAAPARVSLEDGRVIEAPLVIGADGRGSPLRAQARIKTVKWRYGQTGIVATVAHEKPHHGVAQEYFLPSGPFAILPIPGDQSSLVWTEDEQRAPALMALGDDDFNAQLTDRFGPYLGATKAVGPKWTYPLNFHLAHTFIAPRLALIGDAAHGIHPIAGQGFNLGLKDIAALADVLENAAGLGLDIGHLSVLERYQRWRRFDVASMAFGTDAINRLFSNDVAPVRALRGIGLDAVNAIAPLKRFFMRHAGGDIGDLPALMRP